jgi:hypothetical protein
MDRRRYLITETDDVAEALAEAATHWPGEPPTTLLRRLIAEGHDALRADAAVRRIGVAETSGALTGFYHPGYLDELRAAWPA